MTLRQELEEFGYLFIRGFHPDNLIKIARKSKRIFLIVLLDFFTYFLKGILEYIQSSGGQEKFKSGVPLDSAVLDSRCGRGCLPFMEVKGSYKLKLHCLLPYLYF